MLGRDSLVEKQCCGNTMTEEVRELVQTPDEGIAKECQNMLYGSC